MRKKILLPLLLLPASLFAKGDSLNYSLSLGAQLGDGNIKSYNYTANGELRGISQSGKREWDVLPTYKYMETYKYPITATTVPVIQNEFYSNSSMSYWMFPNWKYLIFSEGEHSQLRRIDYRVNLGAGVTYKLLDKKSLKMSLSGVILPEIYQTLPVKTAFLDKGYKAVRISLRAKLVYSKDPVTFSTFHIFQPSLYTQADWDGESLGWASNTNYRSSTSLEVKVFKGFSMGLQFDYVHQSYLNYLLTLTDIQRSGVWVSPWDYSLMAFIKYKK